MSGRFEYFMDLPPELRNIIWSYCLETEANVFRLIIWSHNDWFNNRDWYHDTMGILGERGAMALTTPLYLQKYNDLVIADLSAYEPDRPMADPHNYTAVSRIRAVCRESYFFVEAETMRSPWIRLRIPFGDYHLTIHPDRDIVQLGDMRIAKEFMDLDPRNSWFGSDAFISNAFPLLRAIKKVVLLWPSGWELNPETHDPDESALARESILHVQKRNILWAQAHFPNLETVYVVDPAIKLRPGCLPLPHAESFASNENWRIVETLSADDDRPLWENDDALRYMMSIFRRRYVSLAWAAEMIYDVVRLNLPDWEHALEPQVDFKMMAVVPKSGDIDTKHGMQGQNRREND